MQFFREIVDDGILEHITFQTNLYATQQNHFLEMKLRKQLG